MDDNKLKSNAAAQREFFNGLASRWRENGAPDDGRISELLSVIPLNGRVLDVACGAGILDGVLLSMGLEVDGVDISDKMIERARAANAAANYYAEDFYTFTEKVFYNHILVFDSFPHFPDRRLFAEKAYRLLKRDGTLWIFFDQSKESINSRHSARGASVSFGLESAETEAQAFKNLFDVIYLSDGDDRYYIGLRKKCDKFHV